MKPLMMSYLRIMQFVSQAMAFRMEGIQEFLTLAAKFKERESDRIVECGFLDFA